MLIYLYLRELKHRETDTHTASQANRILKRFLAMLQIIQKKNFDSENFQLSSD